jgi:hypothetical protein
MSTLKVEAVRPGPRSLEWLTATIAELKAGDPLAPVTVVVASNHIGLALRRTLAQTGYANVRFGVIGRLLEPFGAPGLTAAGRAPLTGATEEAVIREAVRRRGEPFGSVSMHPALIKALRELFRDIRRAELDEEGISALAKWGRMAAAAVDVYRECSVVVRETGLYDDTDLIESALAKLGTLAGQRLVKEIGAVIVYLPPGLTSNEVNFLRLIAHHLRVDIGLSQFGDDLADAGSSTIARQFAVDLAPIGADTRPNVRLVAAPEATEEVRGAVRHLLARIENGQQLGRVAVAYADPDPYGKLLRDTLDTAGIAWAGIDGRPLSDSWAGRALLGLLRLRERDFSRVDVLAWLGALPEPDPGRVSIGDWDRMSRNAAVVKGAGEWRTRLRREAEEAEADASGMEEAGRSEGLVRFRRREAAAMLRMVDFIEDADMRTRPPADQTWGGLAKWAEDVRRHFVPVKEDWPEREREADDMIREQLAQLGAAAAVEREVTIERFVEACASAFEGRRQAEGKLLSGVALGPISALCGLDFDLVFVLGATEHALPRPDAPNPVFPPDGGPDPLGRADQRRIDQRRSFLAAVWAGREVRVSFHAWDADLRPSYPSPWCTELATSSNGTVTANDLRLGRNAINAELIQSPEAGLELAPALLNLAEWRLVEARSEGHNLEGAGLAAREDLPLGRHMQVRRARLSDGFTEFDGNIETEVAEMPALSDGLSGRAHSASGIEGWASCPFSYFMERLVRVEPTERPEQDIAWSIGATAKGSLVHEILRRFFEELASASRPGPLEKYRSDDTKRIEDIARDEFSRLESSGSTGHRLAWENEKHAIVTDLHTFLSEDEKLRSDGLVPVFFEQSFGMDKGSWPDLVVDLSSGRSARLRGRIDRVDLGPDKDKPQVARLIDYKTGSGSKFKDRDFEKDPVVAGTKVQPSLYAAAIRSTYPGIAVTSGYWFISTKGKFRFLSVTAADDRLRKVLDGMDRGIRAGAFPQVPGDEDNRRDSESWANCRYCPFDRICPTGRDRMWERKRDRPGPMIHLELRADGS